MHGNGLTDRTTHVLTQSVLLTPALARATQELMGAGVPYCGLDLLPLGAVVCGLGVLPAVSYAVLAGHGHRRRRLVHGGGAAHRLTQEATSILPPAHQPARTHATRARALQTTRHLALVTR